MATNSFWKATETFLIMGAKDGLVVPDSGLYNRSLLVIAQNGNILRSHSQIAVSSHFILWKVQCQQKNEKEKKKTEKKDILWDLAFLALFPGKR